MGAAANSQLPQAGSLTMTDQKPSLITQIRRPVVFIPGILLLLMLTGGLGYLILLSPSSIFIKWAQAALPDQITMISIGPYPKETEFKRLQQSKVKYIVSLLDPRLPYEKTLIEEEEKEAAKYGMTVKNFPMASLFDKQIFPDYEEQQQNAVNFLKNIDAPAYMHCYLGKHRVMHVRDQLIKAGVPKRYWTPAASSQEYWKTVNGINDAREAFANKDYAKVLDILALVKSKDVDVTNLRGWSHYHLNMIDEASEDFRQGLEVEPDNPRNLIGSGYCYLRRGDTNMAQRQFSAVLEQIPDNEEALIGMGLTHLRMGNKAAAAQLFQQVLAKDPGNDEAKMYLEQSKAS
jgi:tetratricopeptide (TPR) repeat protein